MLSSFNSTTCAFYSRYLRIPYEFDGCVESAALGTCSAILIFAVTARRLEDVKLLLASQIPFSLRAPGDCGLMVQRAVDWWYNELRLRAILLSGRRRLIGVCCRTKMGEADGREHARVLPSCVRYLLKLLDRVNA